MKKNFLKLSALAIVLFYSCSNQPECSSSDAKKTTFELAEELIVTDLAFQEFVKGERFNLLLDIQSESKLMKMKEEIQNEISNKIQMYETDSTVYTKYTNGAIELFEGLNPKLASIRTSEKSEDIKKCFCDAEITLNNGNSIGISYSVQIAEDGEIYVETQINE
jgi:hypothetical protein